MQMDFHYYCIAVLARAAGFNRDDALIIAYASQYVDNSTESKQLEIIDPNTGRILAFDPVRSAYDLLKPRQGLESLEWSSQKKVWIPFHFIPPHPFDFENPRFDFVTRPGSAFAELVLSDAANEPHYLRRLIRIGVAMHTYADTWAHHGFSGRRSEEENEVEGLEVAVPESDQWKLLVIENLLDDVLPEIGHAEAMFLPDVPYLHWRCEIGPEGIVGGGDNVKRFLRASKRIFDRLRQIRTTHSDDPIEPVPWGNGWEDSLSWRQLRPLIKERFEERPLPIETFFQRLRNLGDDLETRCASWRRMFGDWFKDHRSGPSNDWDFGYRQEYQYNHKEWRDEALEGDTAWDSWSSGRWARTSPFRLGIKRKWFWESRWVHFHRAALRQRHLVLENLP